MNDTPTTAAQGAGPSERFGQLVLDTFAFEFKWAHATALYRTFAVPRMAELLVRTGEIERDTKKRQLDTGLLMYELFAAGLDSPRGREAVRKINRMHRRWAIAEEDYAYTLAVFVVVPVRFIDRYGWRQTTADERGVLAAWYHQLGRRMGIADAPEVYEDYERIFDDYEATNLAWSAQGEQLMRRTSDALAELYPPPLRPLASTVNALLLGENICRCVGLNPPGRAAELAFWTLLRLRALLVRTGALRSHKPVFTPGGTVRGLYPSGYDLDALGVEVTR